MIRRVEPRNYFVPMSGDPRLHRELVWYATDDDKVLGVLILDLVDNDFSWVVLMQTGEIAPGAYVCVDAGTSLPTRTAAWIELNLAMIREHERRFRRYS